MTIFLNLITYAKMLFPNKDPFTGIGGHIFLEDTDQPVTSHASQTESVILQGLIQALQWIHGHYQLVTSSPLFSSERKIEEIEHAFLYFFVLNC